MKLAHAASVAAALALACACGGQRPHVAAPMPAEPPVVTSTAAETTPAPVVVVAPSDAAVQAFLGPLPGEIAADAAPIPGISEPTAKESALFAKCVAARQKALEKTAKQPFQKQFVAATKAMDKVSKSCIELGLRQQTQASAKLHDTLAQDEMRLLARGVAQSSSCDKGATNPQSSMGACLKSGEFLWDREGWSCIAKAISDEDQRNLALSTSYVYSFRTDAALKTFEIVGRGCSMLLGSKDNAETELVLRGRLSEPTDTLTIFRRAPTKTK